MRNKKIFAHEHILHTKQSLEAHMRKEHRFCEYCQQYLYSDDELYVHMRDRHEQCHICKQRGSQEAAQTYYRNYEALERHFRKDHFLCENQNCLEKKFVVFPVSRALLCVLFRHRSLMFPRALERHGLQSASTYRTRIRTDEPRAT